MAKYLCIFAMKGNVSNKFSFENEFDYLSFLFTHRKEMDWAKLIDQVSGEVVDEYNNFRVVKPEYFNLQITKELFPNVSTLLMLNKQKLIWFINIINRYTKEGSSNIKNGGLKMKFYPVRKCSTDEQGFFIPPNLVLVDKDELMEQYDEIQEKLKDKPYELRVLRHFVDLEGFEIQIDNLLLN